MASGDKASQKGWTIPPDTQSHKQGAENDRYALDRLAEEVDGRAAADANLASAIAGANARIAALTALDIANGNSTVNADLGYLGGAVENLGNHITNLYNIMRAHGWNV